MITDSQTNFVYIADILLSTYPNFGKNLLSKLNEFEINHAILPNTKDVWAVDYMPIQITKNKFVRFTYKPDYLVKYKKYRKTISDVDEICKEIGFKTIKSDIVLDGGNFSKWKDRVLMTTKIFSENKNIPEMELIERLKNLLEINKIFFVPVEKGDWLGHSDGMARFIKEDTVLINEFKDDEPIYYEGFLTSLRKNKLNWETLPYNPFDNKSKNDASGLYLNYLEMEKRVFLPVFNFKEDELALKKLNEIFPNKTIVPVLSNQPAKDNGIINCLTWNILQ